MWSECISSYSNPDDEYSLLLQRFDAELLGSVSQRPSLQANVFVVGDPDQAIYGWRGANVVNMSKSFGDDYPGAGHSLAWCLMQVMSYSYHHQFQSCTMTLKTQQLQRTVHKST